MPQVSPGSPGNFSGGGGSSTITSFLGLTSAGQQLMAASVPVVIASNQTNVPVNVAQINGITPLMGNGVTGTGSARVTVASDNSAVALWGHGVIGSAVPANATYIGIKNGANMIAIKGDSEGNVAIVGRTVTASGADTTNNNYQTWSDISSNTIEWRTRPLIFNGSTWDRPRSIVNSTDSTGTGIQAVGLVAQFDDTLPSTVTENQFGNLRISTNRNLYTTIRDAGGNERGVTVTASNELLVNVNNTLTVSTHAVTQSGTWTVQPGNTANTTPWLVKPHDGTNALFSSAAALADATSNPTVGGIQNFLMLFNGTTWDRVRGDTTNGIFVNVKSLPALAAGTNVIGHVIVDSGTITTVTTVTTVSTVTNLAQMNGAALLMGNGVTGTGSQRVTIASDNSAIATWGQGATGSAVPSGAIYNGGIAQTSLPSAATAGNLTGMMVDKYQRQVMILGTLRDLVGTQATTISASTTETTIVTAAASTFNDLVMLIVSNTSASTNTRIDFRDTTAGSILFSLESIGGAAPVGFALPVPIPQTSVNTNWTAQCATSTTDIRIYAVFQKNK